MAAKNYFSATRIAMIALFSALAGVLYILNFSIPFAFPGFLEFRFSDVPVLIGTFALGPVAGCIIVVFMVLIKLVIVSTSTYFVGDLADILVGFALVIPVGIIYNKNRTFKGALLGLGAGSLISTALAVLLNRILLVPAYVHLMFGGSWEPILGMMTGAHPRHDDAALPELHSGEFLFALSLGVRASLQSAALPRRVSSYPARL